MEPETPKRRRPARGQVVTAAVAFAAGILATLAVGLYRDYSLDPQCEAAERSADVILEDAATAAEVEELRRQLEDDPDLARVEFVSQDEAYEEFLELYGDEERLTETISRDDLPAHFVVEAVDEDALGRIWDLSSPVIDEVTNKSPPPEIWSHCLVRGPIGDVVE